MPRSRCSHCSPQAGWQSSGTGPPSSASSSCGSAAPTRHSNAARMRSGFSARSNASRQKRPRPWRSSRAADATAADARGALDASRADQARAAGERRTAEEAERAAARALEALVREASWQEAQAERLAAEVARLREAVVDHEAAAADRRAATTAGAAPDDGAALVTWEARVAELRASRDRLAAEQATFDAAHREAESRRARAEATAGMDEERIERSEREAAALGEPRQNARCRARRAWRGAGNCEGAGDGRSGSPRRAFVQPTQRHASAWARPSEMPRPPGSDCARPTSAFDRRSGPISRHGWVVTRSASSSWSSWPAWASLGSDGFGRRQGRRPRPLPVPLPMPMIQRRPHQTRRANPTRPLRSSPPLRRSPIGGPRFRRPRNRRPRDGWPPSGAATTNSVRPIRSPSTSTPN